MNPTGLQKALEVWKHLAKKVLMKSMKMEFSGTDLVDLREGREAGNVGCPTLSIKAFPKIENSNLYTSEIQR